MVREKSRTQNSYCCIKLCFKNWAQKQDWERYMEIVEDTIFGCWNGNAVFMFALQRVLNMMETNFQARRSEEASQIFIQAFLFENLQISELAFILFNLIRQPLGRARRCGTRPRFAEVQHSITTGILPLAQPISYSDFPMLTGIRVFGSIQFYHMRRFDH